MITFLQFWAGGFYLANKVFLALTERKLLDHERMWRIIAWSVYLIGLPAWCVLFVIKSNWIALGVESGGGLSMIIGLVIAVRGQKKTPAWLDWIALGTAVIGIGYSLWDFGGINTWNQGLELGLVTGFLIGTYLLAKKRRSGYLWFMLMNSCAGSLMWIQDMRWLTLQQAISLGLVIYTYYTSRRKKTS